MLLSPPGRATTGVVADPGDPTVPAPTQPPPTADTVPQTDPAPTVQETVPSSQVPETAPPTTVWNQGGSSNGSPDRSDSADRSERSGSSQTDDDTPSSTSMPTMTTTEDLLIGPSTTAAPVTTIEPRELSGSSVTTKAGSSDPRIWAVVGALCLVAFGLGCATWWYWRRTNPGEAGTGDRRGDRDDKRGRGRSRRRSRYADLVVTSPEPH